MRKPFFPVGLNLDGRRCVVIGTADDREAIEKTAALRESGADVVRLADPGAVRDDDLAGAFLVVSTPQDANLSVRLRALADRHRFLLCCIDQPAYGFVAMTALAKAGPVRVAVSTAGLAPRVGKAIKEALQRAMDDRFAGFVERLGAQRERIRAEHPSPAESGLRRQAALDAARGFEADVRFRYPHEPEGADDRAVRSEHVPAAAAPSVELIAVGTELLLGQLVDTNTSFVARRLSEIGIDVLAMHAVGDNRERIAAAIRSVLSRRDGAIVTGGLGPTVDDLTKEAVCDALGLGAEPYAPALRHMEAFFAASGREMPPNNRKQADLPRGSVPLENPNGTAPGFVACSAEGRFVACMPGVPHEMRAMLRERLLPLLRERYGRRDAIYTRTIHTVGIGESEIDRRIDELFRSSENPKIAVLAHAGRADVKIMAKASSPDRARAAIEPLERAIAARLSGFVYGTDEVTLESAVHALLQARGRYAVTAESCTGGRIAAALTGVAGSSRSFLGGVIAYDDAVKIDVLGVDPDTLAREGAASEAVAAEMARGVRRRLQADVAIAVTGIAGPGGATPEKPVGLVWFAIDDAAGATRTRRLRLPGERAAVQTRAATAGLGLLWRHLAGCGG